MVFACRVEVARRLGYDMATVMDLRRIQDNEGNRMRHLLRYALMTLALLVGSPAVKSDPAHQLRLHLKDIEDVIFEEEDAWLQLAASANEQLCILSGDHQGMLLEISLEEVKIMTVYISAKIETGVIRIRQPSGEALSKLKQIERAVQARHVTHYPNQNSEDKAKKVR